MAGKSKITSNLKINIDYEIENSQKIRKEIEKILGSGSFSDSINKELQKKIDTLKKVEKELNKVPEKGGTASNEQIKNINKYAQLITKTAEQSKELATELGKVGLTKEALKQINQFEKNIEEIKKQFEQLSGKSLVDTNQKPIDDYIIKLNKQIAKQEQLVKQQPKITKNSVPESDKTEKARQKYESLISTIQQYNKVLKQMRATEDENKKSELGIQATGKVSTGTETGMKKEIDALTGKANKAQMAYQQSIVADEKKYIEQLQQEKVEKLNILKADKSRAVELEKMLQTNVAGINNVRTNDENIVNTKSINESVKALDSLQSSSETYSNNINKATESTMYWGDALEDLKSQFMLITSFGFLLDKTVQAINKAATQTKEIDKDMVQIGLVLQQTSSKTWENFDTYSKTADRLSTTTSEVTAAMKLFYQQGLSTAEVNKMVEASAIAAALGESTLADAAETLTSIVNSYELSADQALDVTDKISQVAIVSAADFGEMSVAIEKVASSAASAGLDLDHLMGYLGKMIETTREAPTNIGTALKTIVANFTSFSEDPTFVTDEGISVNDVDEALKSVGVELKDSEGQIRDLGEVIDELGVQWEGLSKNQKAYLATTIAGTRQQSRFYALMNDYDRTLELVNEGTNSSGKASQQFALYQDSLTASTQRLENQWQKLYNSITGGDTILKGFYNTLTNIMTIVNKLGPGLSALIGGFGLKGGRDLFTSIFQSGNIVQNSLNNLLNTQNLTSVIAQAQQTGNKIGEELVQGIQFGSSKKGKTTDKIGSGIFKKLVNETDLQQLNQYNQILEALKSDTLEGLTENYQKLINNGMGPQIEALTGLNSVQMTNIGLTKSEQAAQVQSTLMKNKDTAVTNINTAAKWANVAAQAAMTLGISALIAGVTSLLPYLLDWNKYNREQAAEAEEAYNSISTENKSLEDSMNTYIELKNKISLTSDEKQELLEVNEELANNYPELIEGYDSEGNAILRNTQYLKDYLKTKKEESQEKAKTMAEKTTTATEVYGKGVLSRFNLRSDEDITSESAKSTYEQMQTTLDNLWSDSKLNYFNLGLSGDLKKLTGPDSQESVIEDVANQLGTTDEQKAQYENLFNQARKFYQQNLEGLQDDYQSYYEETISLLTYEQNNLNSEQSSFVEGLSKTFVDDTSSQKIDEIINQYKNGEIKYKEAQEQITSYLEGEGAASVTTITEALSTVAKSSNFEKVKEIYDEYTTAQSEGYSYIEQQGIANKLIEQINKTPGLSNEQKEALTNSIKSQQEQTTKQLEDAIKQAISASTGENKENIDTSSEEYKQYENVFKSLSTEGQQALSNAINNFVSGENDDLNLTEVERKALSEKIIPSISELINNEEIGKQFSEDLAELDFSDSIATENFKAKYGKPLMEILEKNGISEELTAAIVDSTIPDPGNVSKKIQERMGNLKQSFEEINEVSIEDLTSGEMSVTDAAEAGVLDLGFTVGDKFIASTQSVTQALGEANDQMLIYIEELRRSAVEEVEKANQAIDEAQAKINDIQQGRSIESLSYEEQKQVDSLQEQIAEKKEDISIANRRLENAKKLTAEYQQQAKELEYINQYAEVQDAAESVNTLVNSITDLSDAWEKANEGSLSQLDIIKMIAEDSSLLQFLEVENGQLQLSASSMEQYAETKAQAVRDSIQLDISRLEALYNMIDAEKTYTTAEMAEYARRAQAEVDAANQSKDTQQKEVVNLGELVEAHSDASVGIDTSLGEVSTNTASAAQSSTNSLRQWAQILGDFLGKAIRGLSSLGSAIGKAFSGEINFSDIWSTAVNGLANELRNTAPKNVTSSYSGTSGAGANSINKDNYGWATFEVNQSGTITGSEWQAQIQDKIKKLKAIQNAISGDDLLKKVGEMGSSGSDKDKDEDSYEATVEHLEHFYNYLRKIESLQAKITKLQTKRSTLDLTTNYNIEALRQENDLLKEQASLYNEYVNEETKYLSQLRSQLTAAYGDWVYFTNEGVVQVKQTDFSITSEAEEERYNSFSELLEEYQSEYQTYLDNQNTLLETQQSIIENIQSAYEKINQELDDTISYLEYVNSISEHRTDMSVGSLQELQAYNQELSTTIDMYTYAKSTLAGLEADMAQLTSQINNQGVSQYVNWNSRTNQYQTSDLFNQQVLSGSISGDTVTLVQSMVAASQTLNEQWQDINDKVMSIESSLKTIVENRLQAIENLLGNWQDEFQNIFDIIDRQLDIKNTLFDLTGYDTGDLEEKYKLLANAAAMTKVSWEEMQKLTKNALDAITKEYGDYVTMIDGTPFINETAIEESTTLTDEQKAKAKELIAAYNQLKETTDDLEDSTYDYLDALKELQQNQLDQTIDILQKIHDELKEIDQEELEDLQEKYEKMNSLDEEYYNNLSQRITDARNQRDQLQNQQTLAQKQQQLSALQRDTSGAYNSQIISLQQEINSLMQSNADTDVDNELERIQREQEERQQDREMQIQQLENLITFKDENGMYWQQANDLLNQGYQVVSGFLAAREQNNDQSELATQEAIAQTNQQLADVYAKLGDYSTEDLQTSMDIQQMLKDFLNGGGDNSISGLLNKLGLLDSDITSNMTNSMKSVSDVINSGFAQSLVTIQNGYNTFWSQFDRLRANISNNGTGIINALNRSSSKASSDAAVITDLGRAVANYTSSTASNTNRGANNAGSAASNARNAANAGWSAADSARNAASQVSSLRGYISWIAESASKTAIYTNRLKHSYSFYMYGGSIGMGLNLGYLRGQVYKTGGYADYTGPAWVDGTKTKPEAFLNAKQTALFEQLRDNLTATNVSGATKVKNSDENKGDTINIDTFAIQVQEMADTETVDKVIKKVKDSIYTDATGKNKMQIRRR